MTQQFTADMARKMAEEALSLDGSYGREATEKMLDHIRECAQKGQRSCRMLAEVPEEFDTVVIQRLEALGFIITHKVGGQREPDDCYTEISW